VTKVRYWNTKGHLDNSILKKSVTWFFNIFYLLSKNEAPERQLANLNYIELSLKKFTLQMWLSKCSQNNLKTRGKVMKWNVTPVWTNTIHCKIYIYSIKKTYLMLTLLKWKTNFGLALSRWKTYLVPNTLARWRTYLELTLRIFKISAVEGQQLAFIQSGIYEFTQKT